jgi:hypothetical protein
MKHSRPRLPTRSWVVDLAGDKFRGDGDALFFSSFLLVLLRTTKANRTLHQIELLTKWLLRARTVTEKKLQISYEFVQNPSFRTCIKKKRILKNRHLTRYIPLFKIDILRVMKTAHRTDKRYRTGKCNVDRRDLLGGIMTDLADASRRTALISFLGERTIVQRF